MGDEQETPHHGYEVEYLSSIPQSVGAHSASPIQKCAHPAARDYDISSTPGGHESAPRLVLFDEDDDKIASYSGLSWIAIRKLARPANPPGSTDIGRTL